MDVAPSYVNPPLRCCQPTGDLPIVACGQVATWLRPARDAYPNRFYCDEHRAADDLPIPPDVVFRRVRVQLEVIVAATSQHATTAEREACATVERALATIPGIVSLWSTSSQMARAAAPRQPGRETGDGGVSG
jgi:hypothetical protein